MGATKKQKSNAIYLQVVNGMLCQYVGTTKTDDSFEYKSKFYERFDSAIGRLSYIGVDDVESKDGNSWKELQLKLVEEGQPDVLIKMSFNSRECVQLVNRLIEADLEKPVELKFFKGEAEKNVSLVYQNEKLVPFYATKDNPKDMPQMTSKTDRRGKTTWNSDELMEWIEEKVNDMFETCKQITISLKTVGEAAQAAETDQDLF